MTGMHNREPRLSYPVRVYAGRVSKDHILWYAKLHD